MSEEGNGLAKTNESQNFQISKLTNNSFVVYGAALKRTGEKKLSFNLLSLPGLNKRFLIFAKVGLEQSIIHYYFF